MNNTSYKPFSNSSGNNTSAHGGGQSFHLSGLSGQFSASKFIFMRQSSHLLELSEQALIIFVVYVGIFQKPSQDRTYALKIFARYFGIFYSIIFSRDSLIPIATKNAPNYTTNAAYHIIKAIRVITMAVSLSSLHSVFLFWLFCFFSLVIIIASMNCKIK